MVTTLNDPKRLALAERLADLRAFQHLIISNDQKLIDACPYEDIRERLQNILADDKKNIGIIDTVSVQYGIGSEPSAATKIFIPQFEQMMSGDEFTFYQKLMHHELMKHGQAMSGITIHKAAQVVGADIEAAITPLNTVNFESRAHQEQLKGMLEQVGVLELTGQEPDRGLWARVEDAIAALTGVIGSVVTRSDDEMSIRDLLLMDHTKSDILFAEILGSDEEQKIQEYFGQLYQDVKIHGLAEEQVLYPAVRPYYDRIEEIFAQTDGAIAMLDKARSFSPAAPDFKTQMKQLRSAVREHINQEENDIFPVLRDNFSHGQQKQIASEFKAAKSKLQNQKDSPVLPLPASQDKSRNSDRVGFNSTNNSNTWKLIFQVKAVINWVEAIVFLFADRAIREFLNTEPLTNPEYSQLFYIVVFLIGIGYWWVGRDISQNHDIVKLGIYIQSSVFAVLAYHTLLGNLHPFYLASGAIDMTFAILFVWFLNSYSQSRKATQTKEVLE